MGQQKNGLRLAAKEAGFKHYKGAPCTHCGGTLRYTRNGGCIPCQQEATARCQAKKRTGKRKRRRFDRRVQRLLNNARHRAQEKGLICTLTLDWIEKQLAVGCAKTGVAFDLTPGPRVPATPSIDRIAVEGHYTPDNCQLVCWYYNCAKHTWTHEDVVRMSWKVLEKAAQETPGALGAPGAASA